MEASGISALSIRHPIATSLVMVGILFVGIVAYPLLPVAPLPQVDFPTIQVTASYPGASPETMASSVAQPLERQFSQIPDVSEMTSSSALGTTRVTLQFNLDRDIDAAANDVQAAINAAGGQLPANLPAPPTYRKSNPADAPIMILAVSSKAVPLTDVDDAADTKLAQRISQVQGVAQVLIGGEQKPAVRLQIDPAKLVAKGLSLEDVRNAASVITVNSPKGTIDGKTQSFTIYANDQLTAAKDWNESIVAYRNGAPMRIKDIGQAVTGPEDTKQAAWADGQRGVFLMVFKQPGANVIQIVDKIKSQLPQLQASIPQTIDVTIVSDRTTTIRASIEDVQVTLLLTIVLVVLVIFVFLRSPWATIIPSVTVPLALLGACGLMWIAGYSLDNLSLMALTISVGFVVDDAIVMLENITRHIEEGEKPYEAALKGSSEIGFTIVAISVSLVAVLIPLLLMSGIIGRLFREFAVTLTMAIGVSALVSLTLTPTLCALFLKSEKETKHGRIYQWSERAFDGMLKGYERGLDFVLARRLTTLIVFIVTVALTGLLYRLDSQGLLPRAGHRPDLGPVRSRRGRLVRRDDPAAGGARRHRPAGPGGRQHCDESRRQQERLGAQRRAGLHHAEAAQRARRLGAAGDRAAAAEARSGPGRQAVPSGAAGRPHGRAAEPHAVPVRHPGPGHRRAQRMVAANPGHVAEACRSFRTSPPTSRPTARRSRCRSTATRRRATASSRN